MAADLRRPPGAAARHARPPAAGDPGAAPNRGAVGPGDRDRGGPAPTAVRVTQHRALAKLRGARRPRRVGVADAAHARPCTVPTGATTTRSAEHDHPGRHRDIDGARPSGPDKVTERRPPWNASSRGTSIPASRQHYATETQSTWPATPTTGLYVSQPPELVLRRSERRDCHKTLKA